MDDAKSVNLRAESDEGERGWGDSSDEAKAEAEAVGSRVSVLCCVQKVRNSCNSARNRPGRSRYRPRTHRL